MGMIFGKIDVEQASHDILSHEFPTPDISLRRYHQHVLARVPSTSAKENEMFRILARYIGVFGTPENINSNSIAMTAPVLSAPSSSKIAMTAPVLSSSSMHDMSFVLPAKYTTKTQAPQPTDSRVELVDVPERTVAVKTFSGMVSMEEAEAMANEFKSELETQGFEIDTMNDWSLARYNPPFTLWFLRTNEIWVNIADSGAIHNPPSSNL
jgi:hypothetical protein